MGYELKQDDILAITELTERWYECSNSVTEGVFELENFRLMAQGTYRWLEKFRNDFAFPKEIIALLQSIQHFVSATPRHISKESDAACCVAKAFCDTRHCFSIGGFDGNTDLSVAGAKNMHYLKPDTFDMTELIDDAT